MIIKNEMYCSKTKLGKILETILSLIIIVPLLPLILVYFTGSLSILFCEKVSYLEYKLIKLICDRFKL